MFKDFNWFYTFLRQFNGVVYYDITPVQAELHLYASLTGMGVIFDNQCYALPILNNFQNFSIVYLEMINILVALKVWAYQWKDKKIRVKCDNMAVVEVLTLGKTKYSVLGTCARNRCYLPCLTFLFILSIFLANPMSLLTYFLGLSLIKSLMNCLQHMFLMCHGSLLILT